MRRIGGLLLVIVCILASASAPAEGSGVQVRPTGTGIVETKPREVVTVAVRVTNVGREKAKFLGRVNLPRDWKLVTEDFPFEIAAGESDVRLVSFFAPRVALCGKYRIVYSVTDAAIPSVSDTCTITVIVVPVAKLEATLLRVPQYVIAGEDYQASFFIVNQGNSPSMVAVKVESSDDFPAEVDAENIELGAGESRRVTVTVRSDPEVRRSVRHRLKLTASASELKDQEVSASARSFAEVIPRIAGIEDPFHRLPVKVRFRSVMERNGETEQGFQAEISGSGTLDEQGTKQLDFLFRGPDIWQRSVFGERDEYRLAYQTEKYGVRLGDHYYSLSPLTELYRYGRGAEGRLNLGSFTLGGHRVESRWLEPKEEQTAAHLTYLMNESYQFGLIYLKKNESGTFPGREALPKAIFSA